MDNKNKKLFEEMAEIGQEQMEREKAIESLRWMAKEYAEAGGDYGPKMREYRKACKILGINDNTNIPED